MSAEQLLHNYARRRLSPVEALQAVTERVARRNPALNAFAVMNPRALQAAGESEARWMAGRPIGLLDGLRPTQPLGGGQVAKTSAARPAATGCAGDTTNCGMLLRPRIESLAER